LEIGSLYGMSAAYGVGLGIWFDAETGISDPGLQFIPPVLMGVALPIGVYFLDDPPMPRGMPAAIAAGMFVGAGEGLGVWSFQFTRAKSEDAWGFRGASRAMALGGGLGAGAGFAMAYYMEPSPKSSFLLGSASLWGGVVGSMIGYGSTAKGIGYGLSNDSAALGGLVGYNIGVAAAAGLSAIYVPAWDSIGWMWAGAGIGAAAGLPVYLLYAGSDNPTKRGLIVHGVLISVGIAAGGIFSSALTDAYQASSIDNKPKFAEITTFGLMPVDGGMGVQLMGSLY